MSLRQDYIELNQRHAGYIAAAQAAYDAGNKDEFRTNMDAAKAIGGDLEQMKADLMEMDRSAVLYSPGDRTPKDAAAAHAAKQVTKAEFDAMTDAEINEAFTAGRLADILTGKEG